MDELEKLGSYELAMRVDHSATHVIVTCGLCRMVLHSELKPLSFTDVGFLVGRLVRLHVQDLR